MSTSKALARLLLLSIAMASSGCWEVHKRDEQTIAAVKSAIKYRSEDAEYWEAVLLRAVKDNPNPGDFDIAVKTVKWKTKAELDRLNALLKYEESKKDE